MSISWNPGVAPDHAEQPVRRTAGGSSPIIPATAVFVNSPATAGTLTVRYCKSCTIRITREQCMSSATADTINADPSAFIKA